VPDTSPGCAVPSANVYENTPVTLPVPAVDPTLATTVVLAVSPAATTRVPVIDTAPLAPTTKLLAIPVVLPADPKLTVAVVVVPAAVNTTKLSGIAPCGNTNGTLEFTVAPIDTAVAVAVDDKNVITSEAIKVPAETPDSFCCPP